MAQKPQDNSPQGNAARASIAKQQRENRRRNRGTTDPADWSNCNPDKLRDAVIALTSAGCAVQFGLTKDQGTFVVRIVGDGDAYNEFVRPSEDIDLYLTNLSLDFAK